MKAAVLGSPSAHSLSPVLHTAAYQALGLDDWPAPLEVMGAVGEAELARRVAA